MSQAKINVKRSKKGWVVTPAAMRNKHGLNPGAKFKLVGYGCVLAFVPVFKDPAWEGAGILKGGDSLTGFVAEEHHQELD